MGCSTSSRLSRGFLVELFKKYKNERKLTNSIATMPKFVKILLFVVGGIVLLIVTGVVILLIVLANAFSGGSPPTHLDEERLEILQSDPVYSISYPNMTELRRVERGTRGFTMGTEDPPTIMYYAGTNDSDDEITDFFIDQATSNDWYIFRGPGRLSSAARVSVVLHKDGVGSLFVKVYDPERLNSLLQGEKFSSDYPTIFQVTLRAEHIEP